MGTLTIGGLIFVQAVSVFVLIASIRAGNHPNLRKLLADFTPLMALLVIWGVRYVAKLSIDNVYWVWLFLVPTYLCLLHGTAKGKL